MTILKHIPYTCRTEIEGMAGSPELVEECNEEYKKEIFLEKGVENKKQWRS